jgi:hypothetical protein
MDLLLAIIIGGVVAAAMAMQTVVLVVDSLAKRTIRQ